MGELIEEFLLRLPPVLLEELVEEVLLRLPPDEPAWLVRASAACRSWRRILAAPRFRLRYREFYGAPPPLLGYFIRGNRFVPTSALSPAQAPHHGHMFTMDCRHGRALFVTLPGIFLQIVVLDPLTGHERRVPSHNRQLLWFSAAVLCAAHGQGCDHHGCQGGHFLVVSVSTERSSRVTSGWLYSSETSTWSELTSVHHPNIMCDSNINAQSVLVGDTLYFNADGIIECQLGTLCLSMLQKPVEGEHGAVMAAEDGGLGFAAVVDATNLTMWSSVEAGPEGAVGWAKLRVIHLNTLLPHGALLIPGHGINRSSVRSSTDGAQVLFMTTCVGCYMVDLKSGRARKVSCDGKRIFPYMRFYIPAMEAAACTA